MVSHSPSPFHKIGHGKAVQLLCKYDADYEKLREMENTAGKVAKEIAPDANVKFQFNSKFFSLIDSYHPSSLESCL